MAEVTAVRLQSPRYKPGPCKHFTCTLSFTTANELGTITISIWHMGETEAQRG